MSSYHQVIGSQNWLTSLLSSSGVQKVRLSNKLVHMEVQFKQHCSMQRLIGVWVVKVLIIRMLRHRSNVHILPSVCIAVYTHITHHDTPASSQQVAGRLWRTRDTGFLPCMDSHSHSRELRHKWELGHSNRILDLNGHSWNEIHEKWKL